MGKLVVEHSAHDGDGRIIPGVRIPCHHTVYECCVNHCRVMLPVFALKRVSIHHGIEQVYLQAGVSARIDRNLMFDEIPTQPQDLIVSKIFVRFVPGQEVSLLIEDRVMKSYLSVHVLRRLPLER